MHEKGDMNENTLIKKQLPVVSIRTPPASRIIISPAAISQQWRPNSK